MDDAAKVERLTKLDEVALETARLSYRDYYGAPIFAPDHVRSIVERYLALAAQPATQGQWTSEYDVANEVARMLHYDGLGSEHLNREERAKAHRIAATICKMVGTQGQGPLQVTAEEWAVVIGLYKNRPVNWTDLRTDVNAILAARTPEPAQGAVVVWTKELSEKLAYLWGGEGATDSDLERLYKAGLAVRLDKLGTRAPHGWVMQEVHLKVSRALEAANKRAEAETRENDRLSDMYRRVADQAESAEAALTALIERFAVLVNRWTTAAVGLRPTQPDWADCYADCAKNARAALAATSKAEAGKPCKHAWEQRDVLLDSKLGYDTFERCPECGVTRDMPAQPTRPSLAEALDKANAAWAAEPDPVEAPVWQWEMQRHIKLLDRAVRHIGAVCEVESVDDILDELDGKEGGSDV